MQAKVDVRLRRSVRWREGAFSDEDPARVHRGGVAVLLGEDAYPPSEVAEVRVYGECRVELLDLAVEAGYWVIGRPARKVGEA